MVELVYYYIFNTIYKKVSIHSGALSVGKFSNYNTGEKTVDNCGYNSWRVPRSLYVKYIFCRIPNIIVIIKAT